MRLIRILICCGGLALLLSGCWFKARGDSVMAFKRISPRMASQMEYLIDRGCDREFEYFDRDIAMLYSVIPGGGQFYTGELGKGLLYLLSSPLVIPYVVAFHDAANTVDYYNFKYTIHSCRHKLRLSRRQTPARDIVIRESR